MEYAKLPISTIWMGIFIGNLAYFIIEILINVNYQKKVRCFRIYHVFSNSLVSLEKYFSPCGCSCPKRFSTDFRALT